MEQVVVNGLYLGAQYALIALGLTLIFALMNVLNFAHGQMYVLGGFITYVVYARLGLPFASRLKYDREAEAFAAEAAGDTGDAVAKLKDAIAIEDSIDDLSQPPYPVIPANGVSLPGAGVVAPPARRPWPAR